MHFLGMLSFHSIEKRYRFSYEIKRRNKQQHLKLFGRDIDVVMFGKAEEYLKSPYNKVNVVGKVGVNSFNGNDSYQIEALYLEEAKTAKINTNLQNALNVRAKERM